MIDVTEHEDRLDVSGWTVHRPVDTGGDGCDYTVEVEIHDVGLFARGRVAFDGREPENLRDFLVALGRDWRGWTGTRSWTSMGREMTVEAHHNGRSHVCLDVTLHQAERVHPPDAWSANTYLVVEAGEELRRVADAADRLLRPWTP